MSLPVAGAVRARIMYTHDDEDVLEMGTDVFGGERMCSRLLKDDGDYIIPNVPFP